MGGEGRDSGRVEVLRLGYPATWVLRVLCELPPTKNDIAAQQARNALRSQQRELKTRPRADQETGGQGDGEPGDGLQTAASQYAAPIPNRMRCSTHIILTGLPCQQACDSSHTVLYWYWYRVCGNVCWLPHVCFQLH